MIKCIICKKQKREEEFNLFRGRRNKACIECRKENNEWYAKDIDGRRTRQRNYYKENKERVAKYRRITRLSKRYSLSEKDFTDMKIKQNNKCLICGIDFNEINACIDHNHETGKVRGLLCGRCNLKLQPIEDKDFLQKALKYLKSMN